MGLGMKGKKLAQFKFAIEDEGGGEHVMLDMSRILKAQIYTFKRLVHRKAYKELCDDVEKILLGGLTMRLSKT